MAICCQLCLLQALSAKSLCLLETMPIPLFNKVFYWFHCGSCTLWLKPCFNLYAVSAVLFLLVSIFNELFSFQTPYFWPSNCWEPENTDYGESAALLFSQIFVFVHCAGHFEVFMLTICVVNLAEMKKNLSDATAVSEWLMEMLKSHLDLL